MDFLNVREKWIFILKIPIFLWKMQIWFLLKKKKQVRFLFWKIQSRFYKKYKSDFLLKIDQIFVLKTTEQIFS